MSFHNTKTHSLNEIDPKRRKYDVPMRAHNKAGVQEFYLTPDLEKEFRRLYPITMNIKMMEMFGLSHSTLHRIARELGLKKDMAVIRKKHAAMTKKICEKNGYYDSLRGKAPCQAAQDAMHRLRESGFNPIKRLKETNKRKYNALMKRKSADRKALIQKEARRYRIGLLPATDLPAHLYADVQYTRYQSHARSYAKRAGYILGSIDPEGGERTTIFYNDNTKRRPIFERYAAKIGGFDFKPITLRGKVLR